MLKAITLRNFKAFHSLRIPLMPLTMLSGVNGSGKSTVLQSLAALRQSSDAGCLPEGLLLNGDLVELGTGRDVLWEHAAEQYIGLGVETESSQYEWRFRYSERADLLECFEGPQDTNDCSVFHSRTFQFLKADRVSPAAVFQKSYEQVVRKRFLGTRGQYAAHYLAVHQDEIVSASRRNPRGGDSAVSLIGQVTSWLSELSPGIVVDAKEISGADLAQLSFAYGGRAGLASSNEYRPTNVGFGITYSLPIIVACLSAAPGDLLLIENPEAHLHPRGQSALAELLCRTVSDGVQIVFETHSDHVLNGIRRCVKSGVVGRDSVALHFCEFDGQDRSTRLHSPEIDVQGRLSSWPEGFFDEWELALMELV